MTQHTSAWAAPVFLSIAFAALRMDAMTEVSVEKEVKARYAIWYSLGLYSRKELPV